MDASTAWVYETAEQLVFCGEQTCPLPDIAVTHDGGASWQVHTSPCRGFFQGLAAPSATAVFAFCGSVGATDMEAKALYYSRDDGRKWLLVARTSCNPSECKSNPGVGSLSWVGNDVISFGMVDTLHGWLVLSRGGFSLTSDGGRTWQMPAWPPPSAFDDGRYGPALFVDARHGWLVVEADVVRTTDGVHWQPVLLMPSSDMQEVPTASDTASPIPAQTRNGAGTTPGSGQLAANGTPTANAPFSGSPQADATGIPLATATSIE